MKTAYICHPVSTGVHRVCTNLGLIGMIRRCYVEIGYLPIVPTDIMRYVFPTGGDQTGAYATAIEIMLECEEVHVFDGWRQSRGCIKEVEVAQQNGIPIIMQDANEVEEELRLIREEYECH